jgi:hypothetical protein
MTTSQEEIPCPFCVIGKISCNHMPSVWGEKRTGRSSLGSGKRITKSSEQWDIQSNCPNCGKTALEIKRALKEGVPPDKKKLKKRFEDIQRLKEEMKRERESKL